MAKLVGITCGVGKSPRFLKFLPNSLLKEELLTFCVKQLSNRYLMAPSPTKVFSLQ